MHKRINLKQNFGTGSLCSVLMPPRTHDCNMKLAIFINNYDSFLSYVNL